MSGIYIPGMEMPIDCCDCPMSGDYRMCCSLMPGVPALYAEFADAIKTNRRHKDCPLVPVPEHGDLIDRDKLEKDIDKYIGGEESRSRFHHWVQVQCAVIPMDKGAET